MKYQNGADVSIIGQKLNSMISSLFTNTNTYRNIKFTAWITDPEAWTDYKDENGDAVFAIGSPTLELYVASYNNAGKANTISLSADTKGYNTNSGKILNTSYNYGIYNERNKSYWWLASPSSSQDNGMIVHGPNSYFFSHYIGSYANSCRPVVCIPTDIFNSDYLDSVVNE